MNGPVSMPISIKNALVIESNDLVRLALIEEVKVAIPPIFVQGIKSAGGALELMRRWSFDIVLASPSPPDGGVLSSRECFATIAMLVRASPQAKHIILLESKALKEEELRGELSASSYILKENLTRELLSSALKGAISGDIAGPVPTSYEKASSRPEYAYSEFTPREQYVFQKILERPKGMLKKCAMEKIASVLRIDEDTVRKYYKSARSKLRRSHIILEEM